METIFNKKIIYSLACFVACLTLFLYLNRGSDNQPFLKKDASIPAAQSNCPPPLLERNSEAVTENQPNAKKTVAIAKAFYESKDLHAFAEMAKKRPEEGGISYAFNAAYNCGLVRNIPEVKADSSTYTKSVVALNNLRDRCKNFSDKEISTEGLGELAKLKKEKKDILLLVEGDYLRFSSEIKKGENTVSDGKRMQLLDQTAQLQDSQNFQEQGLSLTLFKNGDKKSGYWIDGQPYFTESKKEIVSDAWALASCTIGNDCTGASIFLQASCALNGQCFDNLADYLKQVDYANNPQGYADLISVKDKIVNAIQNKDWRIQFRSATTC
ncbi:hypothetical protein [Undibacterium sp. SXout20W]|uniref:hypothetical protein n=1 Tax=Undibacterium sp. SXout20W TaxID=3413051 RepID=UPI003BF0A904